MFEGTSASGGTYAPPAKKPKVGDREGIETGGAEPNPSATPNITTFPPQAQTSPASPSVQPQTASPVGTNGTPSTSYQAPPANLPQAPAINPTKPAPATPYTYQAGAIPQTALPTYNPYQVTQYQGPNQGSQEAQQQALLNAIMQNPDIFSPAVVAAQKEGQKDTINAQQQAAQQALAQRFASQGTYGGGAYNSNLMNLYDTSQGNLARGYRDIDINAATGNRASELGALGASNDVMNAQLQRAIQNYQTGLAGQQAQAGQNYQGYQSQSDATRYGLEAALAQEQARQAAGQQGMQNYALGQGAYQFDAGQQLAWQQFLENVLQGRGQLGLGYGQLDLANTLAGNNSVFG